MVKYRTSGTQESLLTLERRITLIIKDQIRGDAYSGSGEVSRFSLPPPAS